MAFDPVSIALEVGSKLIDRLWPDPEKRDAAKLELYKIEKSGELQVLMAETDLMKGQIEVNKVEAASSSLLVAGGRPFVIWVCGSAFAYSAILEPLARFIAAVCFGYHGMFPLIDTNLTMQVLLGVLGLGAMRSYDKKQGTA
jgi:hypothetical protein